MELQPPIRKTQKDLIDLLTEFRGKGKRYTCFPPPSKWEEKNLSAEDWGKQILRNYNEEIGVDLYLHIPFCKSLCTFCGCNIKITNNHDLEVPYIKTLLKEWDFYLKLIPNIRINSLYLGGGTPNFLSSENLNFLLEGIFSNAEKTETFFGSFEADPRIINKETLQTLNKHEIKRISFGIQDLDKKVLLNVNRNQNLEDVKNAITLARNMGMKEVLLDFIYGLHFQNEHTMRETFSKIEELNPDSISFFPLAEAPWQIASQHAFGFKTPLPFRDKNQLFLTGHNNLLKLNYSYLGMGHYISPNSPLQKANSENKIKRNIMGFSEKVSNQIIGLGVSSISFSGESINQNEKILDKYEFQTKKSKWNSFRSANISAQDNDFINSINKIICERKLDLSPIFLEADSSKKSHVLEEFEKLKQNELIELKGQVLYVKEKGKHFFDFILNQLENLL